MPRKKFPREIAEKIIERSGGVCEFLIYGVCIHYAGPIHHRKISGRVHSVPGCVHICRACHDYVHAHPARSYSHGWLVKMNADPGETPVTYRGQPVFLTEDGRTEHYFKPRNDAGLSS